MSFLKRLFGRRENPSQHWRRDAAIDLVLDIDTRQLSGVGLGDSIERLAFLGPGQMPPHMHGVRFPDHGVYFDYTNNEIDCIGVCLADTFDSLATTPFTGDLRWRGQLHDPSLLASEQAVFEVFGSPTRREDEDNDEIVLFYELPQAEWQIEIGPDHRTQFVFISDTSRRP